MCSFSAFTEGGLLGSTSFPVQPVARPRWSHRPDEKMPEHQQPHAQPSSTQQLNPGSIPVQEKMPRHHDSLAAAKAASGAQRHRPDSVSAPEHPGAPHCHAGKARQSTAHELDCLLAVNNPLQSCEPLPEGSQSQHVLGHSAQAAAHVHSLPPQGPPVVKRPSKITPKSLQNDHGKARHLSEAKAISLSRMQQREPEISASDADAQPSFDQQQADKDMAAVPVDEASQKHPSGQSNDKHAGSTVARGHLPDTTSKSHSAVRRKVCCTSSAAGAGRTDHRHGGYSPTCSGKHVADGNLSAAKEQKGTISRLSAKTGVQQGRLQKRQTSQKPDSRLSGRRSELQPVKRLRKLKRLEGKQPTAVLAPVSMGSADAAKSPGELCCPVPLAWIVHRIHKHSRPVNSSKLVNFDAEKVWPWEYAAIQYNSVQVDLSLFANYAVCSEAAAWQVEQQDTLMSWEYLCKVLNKSSSSSTRLFCCQTCCWSPKLVAFAEASHACCRAVAVQYIFVLLNGGIFSFLQTSARELFARDAL